VNALAIDTLPDVHAAGDSRGVELDEVGITGISLPVTVIGPDGDQQPTVAEAELTVALPRHERGTHMSRFVEELTTLGSITPAEVARVTRSLRERLDAPVSRVVVRFPLFLDRVAPATGLSAPHRFDAWIIAVSGASGEHDSVRIGVRAPVTSLCPCSREISDYGAHSQRGYVELEVSSPDWFKTTGVWPHELFAYADSCGSAPVHPLLKRPDEREVTMRAYDNPAFVEDIARDVVLAIKADERCAEWSVTVVNHESIHDHEAIARVRGRR
jgi:GTP cyclohydrolase I